MSGAAAALAATLLATQLQTLPARTAALAAPRAQETTVRGDNEDCVFMAERDTKLLFFVPRHHLVLCVNQDRRTVTGAIVSRLGFPDCELRGYFDLENAKCLQLDVCGVTARSSACQ
jgi:hypothetical protein